MSPKFKNSILENRDNDGAEMSFRSKNKKTHLRAKKPVYTPDTAKKGRVYPPHGIIEMEKKAKYYYNNLDEVVDQMEEKKEPPMEVEVMKDENDHTDDGHDGPYLAQRPLYTNQV